MNKNKRQELIRALTVATPVRSQEELQALLQGQGINVTQATLSRDLAEMKVVKVRDANGYSYRPAGVHTVANVPLAALMVSDDGILSLEFSSYCAVIKTKPGFASAVAFIVDNKNLPAVMGTIAGDDTVLLLLRDGFDKDEVRASLVEILPRINEHNK